MPRTTSVTPNGRERSTTLSNGRNVPQVSPSPEKTPPSSPGKLSGPIKTLHVFIEVFFPPPIVQVIESTLDRFPARERWQSIYRTQGPYRIPISATHRYRGTTTFRKYADLTERAAKRVERTSIGFDRAVMWHEERRDGSELTTVYLGLEACGERRWQADPTGSTPFAIAEHRQKRRRMNNGSPLDIFHLVHILASKVSPEGFYPPHDVEQCRYDSYRLPVLYREVKSAGALLSNKAKASLITETVGHLFGKMIGQMVAIGVDTSTGEECLFKLGGATDV